MLQLSYCMDLGNNVVCCVWIQKYPWNFLSISLPMPKSECLESPWLTIEAFVVPGHCIWSLSHSDLMMFYQASQVKVGIMISRVCIQHGTWWKQFCIAWAGGWQGPKKQLSSVHQDSSIKGIGCECAQILARTREAQGMAKGIISFENTGLKTGVFRNQGQQQRQQLQWQQQQHTHPQVWTKTGVNTKYWRWWWWAAGTNRRRSQPRQGKALASSTKQRGGANGRGNSSYRWWGASFTRGSPHGGSRGAGWVKCCCWSAQYKI